MEKVMWTALVLVAFSLGSESQAIAMHIYVAKWTEDVEVTKARIEILLKNRKGTTGEEADELDQRIEDCRVRVKALEYRIKEYKDVLSRPTRRTSESPAR
jgi:hypothetical protein